MKILPSPTLPSSPVRPALMMALTVGSTNSSLTAICNLTFAQQVDGVLVAAIDLVWPFWRPNLERR